MKREAEEANRLSCKRRRVSQVDSPESVSGPAAQPVLVVSPPAAPYGETIDVN